MTGSELDGRPGSRADAEASGLSDAAVRQKLRLQNKLFEVAPAAIYTCDAEGLITSFNQHAVELWGREPKLNDAEDRFCGAFRLLSPDGSPIRHDECWMALALKEDRSYHEREIRIERRDGSTATVLVHAHPLHDENGELTGAVNVLVDITEHEEAEKAKARLAAIVESADDAIVGKDLDGVITSWNRGAEALFGYTAEEAIGRPVTMLMPPELREEELEILERLRRGETIEHYETVRRRKDGTQLDVSLTISPIVDAEGRIVGASKIGRDITERKEAEEALRAADRRKDEFLAMLSHELRNPLAPIYTAVELLRLNQGEESIRQKALGVLDRQVRTLTRLVDDLLDVSRVRTGSIELQPADVELNAVVRGGIDSVRSLFEERRHRLSVSLARDPVWVHGDATRLEQIVVNLLTNAARYTPEGGDISLTVGLEARPERLDGGRGEAVIRVKDDGVGIEPELLSRIFEMFGQGRSPPDHAESGLGVGLSLVKKLVDMHGGSVAAASEGSGHGSEFTVRLPTISPSSEERRPRSSRVGAAE